MAIGDYYINGYWLLFYKWLLVDILFMIMNGCSIIIDGYSIGEY